MHVLLVARQRAPLLALGAAMAECCAALGSTLVHNAPVACEGGGNREQGPRAVCCTALRKARRAGLLSMPAV